jgi:hypothetical protein
MKSIFLAFLLSLSVSFGAEFATVQNSTNMYLQFADNNGGTFIIPPFQTNYLSEGLYQSSWFTDPSLYDLVTQYDVSILPGLYIADMSFALTAFLPDGIYGPAGAIAEGFTFGLALWAICAGIVWSIKIGKTFASGAT